MASQNSTPPPGATVIWRREIDHAAHAKRNQRFLRWFVIPLVIALVVVALAVDVWSALGVLILFGGIGGLAYAWLWLTNRNERANPTLWTQDGQLHISRKVSVAIADVERYAIRAKRESVNTSEGMTTMLISRAFFRLKDGSLRSDFQWTHMPDTQHPALNDALWGLFPGLSQAHEEMLAS